MDNVEVPVVSNVYADRDGDGAGITDSIWDYASGGDETRKTVSM